MREEDENNRSGTKTVNNTVEPSIFISDDNSGGKTLPAKLKRSDSTA